MSRNTFGFAVRAMIFFLFSQAAPVAILLSALFSERYSLGARWVFSFSRCCYRIRVLSSHLFGGSWAPGLSRSHLDSAAELGCSDQNFLGHRTHGFLAIAQWFVHLASHPQPMEQYRQLSRDSRYRSLLRIFFLLVPQAFVPISANHLASGRTISRGRHRDTFSESRKREIRTSGSTSGV